ncbi:hypothetical protein B0H13DRAFT_2021430 [Mycena leptocephala]|nr:hypothetical protein B0H13DRAFT_2021430 [Mycena leptocephala]
MTPLQVPELVREIAVFVEKSRDLSQFARVDRFTHAVVTPYPHDSIESLAVALRTHPNRAAPCRSLTICGPYHTKLAVLNDNSLHQLHLDLITVLGAISAHGQLVILRWSNREFRGRWVRYSEDVWTAIFSVLGPLRELELHVPESEKFYLYSLARTRFSQLRILRLLLPGVHGGDIAHLQEMLESLSDLEELVLQFPLCCAPSGITLGSTHPHLKCLSLTTCQLFDESDFLARHPTIERLFLDSEQSFSGGSSPNMLRAVNIDESSLFSSPTVLDSQITHLRLREIAEDMDPGLPAAIRAVAQSLRCLELEVQGGFKDDQTEEPNVTVNITHLLRSVPALDELGIIYHKRPPLPPNWASNLLTYVLAAVDPAAPLRALRIYYNETLPQERLDDLGPLPSRLKYIGWDTDATSLIHVVERRGDKNGVGNTLTRSPTDDWTAQTVLGFFGESFGEP